jgi:hypothetical protein
VEGFHNNSGNAFMQLLENFFIVLRVKITEDLAGLRVVICRVVVEGTKSYAILVSNFLHVNELWVFVRSQPTSFSMSGQTPETVPW